MHPVYRTGAPVLSRERFCICNQQIYFIILFFRLAEQSQFIPLQNVVYLIKGRVRQNTTSLLVN